MQMHRPAGSARIRRCGFARVAELADARDLGSRGETLEGSSPSSRTINDDNCSRHPCCGDARGRFSAPVDPAIFREKAGGERTSFLVVLPGAGRPLGRARRSRIGAPGGGSSSRRCGRRADASQAALAARLARAGIPYRAHFLVNMLEVEGGRGHRARARPGPVRARRRSESARRARPRIAAVARRRRSAAIEPNVALVGAPDLWARGFTGQGIVIGIADTGDRLGASRASRAVSRAGTAPRPRTTTTGTTPSTTANP